MKGRLPGELLGLLEYRELDTGALKKGFLKCQSRFHEILFREIVVTLIGDNDLPVGFALLNNFDLLSTQSEAEKPRQKN